MAASTTDKMMKTGASTVTTLSAPGKALAATSLTVGSTTNYPTTTGIVIAIRVVDSAGELVAGTYTEWLATVTSGTTLAIDAAPVYGTDQVYAAGSTTQVFIPLSSYAHNRLIDGVLVEHTQAGIHALTSSSTLTSSKFITALNDTNGNELLKVTATGSAVNELTLANAATGNSPVLSATGGDTNIGITLTPKGTGVVTVANATGIGGAYTSHTPTLTNLTLGTGTMVTKYSQVGKGMKYEGRITIGNNAPSGVLTITLPVASVNTYTAREPIGVGSVFDSSTSTYFPLYAIWISTTTFKLVVLTTLTGANPVFMDMSSSREVSNSTPVAFATGDIISWNLDYEAA